MKFHFYSLAIAFLSLLLSGCYDTGYYGGGHRGHGHHYGNSGRHYRPHGGQFGYQGTRYHSPQRVKKQSLNKARQKKKKWRRKARRR